MTLNITTALVGILITLVGALIALTWRSASLATSLLEAVKQLRTETEELKSRTKALDTLPQLHQQVAFIERHHSEIPKMLSRITVLEEAAKFSKEMRRVMFRSRPDTEDD